MTLLVLFCVGLAAAVTYYLLRALIPQLNRFLLDQPNDRSSHRQPTPSGGGSVFVFVALLASASILLMHGSRDVILATLSLLLFPLAVIGFLDDRHNLSSGLRYGVQLATSCVLILISPLPLASHWLVLPFLVISVTAVINFTNFMDGLDGLVAGCMAVAISSAAIQLAAPWPIWALVGALLGFLLWNWSPAKVFMGDVGSTFLGAIFAALVLQTSTWSEALSLLLVATPLLSDACICVPRRLIAGQRVFQAHRLHLFQRLHQAGWPHARVSCLYIIATSFMGLALICGGLSWVITFAVLEILTAFWLDQRVAVPFFVASRN